MKKHIWATLLLLATGLGPVWAAPARDIDAYIARGEHARALEEIDRQLAAGDRSPGLLLQRGVALMRLGHEEEALVQFEALRQQYPERPEPYVNLAALHAGAGRLGEARGLLERALELDAGFPEARISLGNIYLGLAWQAYQAAEGNQAELARIKATEVERLIRMDRPPLSATPVFTPLPPTVPSTSSSTVPTATVPTATAPGSEGSPAAPAVAEPVTATPPSPPAGPLTPGWEIYLGLWEEAARLLNGWAKAWNGRNASGYLAHYSTRFTPERGLARDKWREQRQELLTKGAAGQISVENIEIAPAKEGVWVRFRQKLGGRASTKEMYLGRENGAWRILREIEHK